MFEGNRDVQYSVNYLETEKNSMTGAVSYSQE